jgi:hypothetical protein
MGRSVIRRTTITAANGSLPYSATRTQLEDRSLDPRGSIRSRSRHSRHPSEGGLVDAGKQLRPGICKQDCVRNEPSDAGRDARTLAPIEVCVAWACQFLAFAANFTRGTPPSTAHCTPRSTSRLGAYSADPAKADSVKSRRREAEWVPGPGHFRRLIDEKSSWRNQICVSRTRLP